VSGSPVFQDMDPDAKQKLMHSISIITSLFQKVSNSEIQIVQLELVCFKRETFIAVAKVFEKHHSSSIPLTIPVLDNQIQCREKDLKCLEETISTVKKLQFLFKEISDSKCILTISLS
jgi:hypothetical protein